MLILTVDVSTSVVLKLENGIGADVVFPCKGELPVLKVPFANGNARDVFANSVMLGVLGVEV